MGVTFLTALLMQETSTALPLTMAGAGHTTRDYGLVITLNGLLVAALQLPAGRAAARFPPALALAVGAVLLGGGLGLTGLASLETYALTVVIWTAARSSSPRPPWPPRPPWHRATRTAATRAPTAAPGPLPPASPRHSRAAHSTPWARRPSGARARRSAPWQPRLRGDPARTAELGRFLRITSPTR
ncbi:hypothetical protein ACFQ3Z_01775 [Streptomyces nogalater]